MSDDSGLYDVHTIANEKFRIWHSTGTLECMEDGVWKSIPEPAQVVCLAAMMMVRPDVRDVIATLRKRMKGEPPQGEKPAPYVAAISARDKGEKG